MTLLPHALPHVVCIMPTRNRHAMLPAAIHGFIDQEYDGQLSLCIDDDSGEPWTPCECMDREMTGASLANWSAEPAPRRWIGYEWQSFVRNCATKRNAIVESMLVAVDETTMFALWDDDDLYGPHRIRRQVETLLAEPKAECCLLMPWTLYDVERGIVAMNSWHPTDGTAVFTKAHWDRAPWDASIDAYSGPARLTQQLTEAPETIISIDGALDYIVVRHGSNNTGAPSENYRGGPWKKPPPCSVADLDVRIRSSAACRSPRCR